LGVVLEHGVEGDEEFSHCGDDGELEGFVGVTQAAGGGGERPLAEAHDAEGGEVEAAPDGRPSA